MQTSVINESGYEEALYGMSLSFKDRAIPEDEWWTEERFEAMQMRAPKQAFMDGGHNKFLESIMVWIDIEMPRYWWQEFDTYRIGMSKQSESTIHTLKNRDLTIDDFDHAKCDSIPAFMLNTINEVRREYVENPSKENFVYLKGILPESFLQRRSACVNYKTLRNMILQRRNHVLPHWQFFIREVLDQVEHPELLPTLED